MRSVITWAKGTLKKKVNQEITDSRASTPRERNIADFLVSDIIGVGATRIDERYQASLGMELARVVHFEACQSLPFGGVLCMVPFLLANGLLSYNSYYCERLKGYYDFDIIIMMLSFMYLCRIRTPEQLKHHSPGELGKLLGLDRVPEAKCLRAIFKELTNQQKAGEWNAYLAQEWIAGEEPAMYYIDGHVQVYHGHLATLGKKHVSRQRLCLPGMMEFWVNNTDGLPYFFITGQVNEKLQQVIEEQIVPHLNEMPYIKEHKNTLDPKAPNYTIVFDREAYSPVFFQSLWEQHRVAVITYRKNVKDLWEEADFVELPVETQWGTVAMPLCEKTVELNGVSLREVRKLSEDGHQTSIITTHPILSTILIALYMFARWSQENFFRYMRQEYDLDRIMQYGVDELDKSIMVVNPEYNNINYKLKKNREKTARRQASLFTLQEENSNTAFDQTRKYVVPQLKLLEEIQTLKKQEQALLEKRKQQPYKIAIGQMPEAVRYNKLKTESKHLQNIIKMICYRAETALANMLASEYKKKTNEIRALLKSVLFSKADIMPDYKNNTLSVKLYSLATPRDNIALEKICHLLNDTDTVFPGSDLKMVFNIATF